MDIHACMCNLIYFYHFTVATHFQKCKQLHKKQDVSALDWPNHRGFWSSPGPWTEDLEYAELSSGGSYSLLISDLHTSELDFMLNVCTDAAVAFRNSLNPTVITHRMQIYEKREPCALICVNLEPNTHTPSHYKCDGDEKRQVWKQTTPLFHHL